MKILIDMNLSPDWADVLQANGILATHWASIGPIAALDSYIMPYALAHHLVILTRDLDFGIALAKSGHAKPSVIQLRLDDILPAAIGAQVLFALRQMEAELEAGELLTIGARKTRISLLPLHPRSSSLS